MKIVRTTLTLALATLVAAASLAAHAADGLIAVKSPHSVPDTAGKLGAALQGKGLKLFARIDHAAGAASINQKLRIASRHGAGNCPVVPNLAKALAGLAAVATAP